MVHAMPGAGQTYALISKEDLLEQLWPGRFVSEAALTSRMMAVRRED
jgi:DNA-binding winged helix-turn-helix (wHTH) protein